MAEDARGIAETMLRTWSEAINRRDTQAVANLYSQHALYSGPAGTANGVNEIQNILAQGPFIKQNMQMDGRVLEARFINADTAIGSGEAYWTGGGKDVTVKWVTASVKENGQWKIALHMAVPNPQ